MSLFHSIRQNIVGIDSTFLSPFGEKKIIYLDWTASGRLYKPIEDLLTNKFGSFVGNTHTESSFTGKTMTDSYHEALSIIKNHVHAKNEDVILTDGSGMTGVINKFQRLMGLRIHEKWSSQIEIEENDKPIVFVTHMEHHSNHTSWIETICDVEIIPPCTKGLVDCGAFVNLLEKYKSRKTKIVSITACSNVTGIKTDYHKLSRIVHEYGGISIVDFSACAPYVQIDMHPENPLEKLDVIVFSPHKFLGGPGSSGVLIFDSKLYKNSVPDHPGGGTVLWTNPWGEKSYFSDIQTRESGGTPPFMQTIRIALCIILKEKMNIEAISLKENFLLEKLFSGLGNINGLHILDGHIKERLPIVSFYIENTHHNLLVKLLNDLYGIQARGGCSCAGTYGHFLLGIDKDVSNSITDELDRGNYYFKPGWVRVSLHPTTTVEEINQLIFGLDYIVKNYEELKAEYLYIESQNEFIHKEISTEDISNWFQF